MALPAVAPFQCACMHWVLAASPLPMSMLQRASVLGVPSNGVQLLPHGTSRSTRPSGQDPPGRPQGATHPGKGRGNLAEELGAGTLGRSPGCLRSKAALAPSAVPFTAVRLLV